MQSGTDMARGSAATVMDGRRMREVIVTGSCMDLKRLLNP